MLDYSEKKYGKGFVSDVKALKNVCYIFLPLPIFWALFDQQVRYRLYNILWLFDISCWLMKQIAGKTFNLYLRDLDGRFKQPVWMERPLEACLLFYLTKCRLPIQCSFCSSFHCLTMWYTRCLVSSSDYLLFCFRILLFARNSLKTIQNNHFNFQLNAIYVRLTFKGL